MVEGEPAKEAEEGEVDKVAGWDGVSRHQRRGNVESMYERRSRRRPVRYSVGRSS